MSSTHRAALPEEPAPETRCLLSLCTQKPEIREAPTSGQELRTLWRALAWAASLTAHRAWHKCPRSPWNRSSQHRGLSCFSHT